MPDQARNRLHRLSKNALERKRISPYSLWSDEIWRLSNPTPGSQRSSSSLNWAFELPDGSRLTDPRWAELLDLLKRFVWSLYSERRRGPGLKPGSLGQLGVGLRPIVRWMVREGLESIQELTAERFEAFLDDFVEEIVEAEGESGLTIGRLEKQLTIWAYLWEQSDVLRESGCQSLDHDPLRGVGIRRKSEQVAKEGLKRIPPFPDEVALPILEAAWSMLEEKAEDVMRLQRLYLEKKRAAEGMSLSMVTKRGNEAICSFEFSKIGNTSEPWHAPVCTQIVKTLRQESSTHTPTIVLRNLILRVRSAAEIVLMAGVGIRPSELCSLRSGWKGGLPSCVEVRSTPDGVLELFYLKGLVSKSNAVPEAGEWVIGCRPCGSAYVPPTVRAVIVLQKLFEPWRKLSGEKDLLVQFSNRCGLPRLGSGVARVTTTTLAFSQRSFVADQVALFAIPDTDRFGSDLTCHKSIEAYRPYRWRKTFARFLFQTNPKLLRALSRHFKHLSIAMTEQGYLGSDRSLIDDLKSTRQRLAAQILYEMTTGKRVAVGPFARIVEEHKTRLLAEAGSGEELKKSLMKLVDEHDLQVSYSPHGKCFISVFPARARCHEAAGTESWSARRPNFAARNPETCLGCACFAIDWEHEAYWINRSKTNQQMFESEKAAGRDQSAHLFYLRARHARAVIKKVCA